MRFFFLIGCMMITSAIAPDAESPDIVFRFYAIVMSIGLVMDISELSNRLGGKGK